MHTKLLKNNMVILTSMEVAKMIKKEHKILLRDIRTYIKQMAEANKTLSTELYPVDYFINSTYQDATGKENPCYLLTKLGCDFVGNKLIGIKGTGFTAFYTKKFNEMEQKQSNLDIKKILTDPDTIITLATNYKAEIAKREKVEEDKKVLEQQIQLDKPKIDGYNAFMNTDKLYDMAMAGAKLGLGRNKLFKLLRDLKILKSDTFHKNQPYQQYIDQKIFKVKENIKQTVYGSQIYSTTYLTSRGLEWLRRILKKKNIHIN